MARRLRIGPDSAGPRAKCCALCATLEADALSAGWLRPAKPASAGTGFGDF